MWKMLKTDFFFQMLLLFFEKNNYLTNTRACASKQYLQVLSHTALPDPTDDNNSSLTV